MYWTALHIYFYIRFINNLVSGFVWVMTECSFPLISSANGNWVFVLGKRFFHFTTFVYLKPSLLVCIVYVSVCLSVRASVSVQECKHIYVYKKRGQSLTSSIFLNSSSPWFWTQSSLSEAKFTILPAKGFLENPAVSCSPALALQQQVTDSGFNIIVRIQIQILMLAWQMFTQFW